MSKNIVEELPARKHAPVAAPVAAKKGGGNAKGGASSESSEKKIRQAVYDIRYRARREDIDLKAAFAQYMSNSSLSQQERTAVREKLFGKDGGGVKEQFTVGADDWAVDGVSQALYKVFVEKTVDENIELAYLNQLDEDQDNKKYKVRVKDKNGKTYVRYADRAKITQLRQNPNIQSVEMTEHGEPYEGEKKKLDPVGKEDADIDNDGDVDKNDKYLHKRRKAIGSAIKKRAGQKLKEDIVVETAKAKVDNYKKGENGKTAVTVAPVSSEPTPEVQAASKRGIYAHLELNGSEISESRKRLLDILSEKAACKSKKKKKDAYYEDADYGYDKEGKSLNPKDKKEEEKKDMRGYYAKINVIKNKLRSKGAKNAMLIADPDAVEKCWDKDKKEDGVKEERTAGYPGGPANMGKSNSKKRVKPVPLPSVKGNGLKGPDGKVYKPVPLPSVKGKSNAVPMPKVKDTPESMRADYESEKKDKKPMSPKTGPGTKKPAPGETRRTFGPGTKPPEKRYNPFKDGRTPTSASQTTGP